MNNPSLVRADVASASNYYTTIEVAKMLGMAVRSVQLMVDRGDLQAWKTPGGHRRISRESLERWLQGSRSGVRAEAAGRQEGEPGAGRIALRQRRYGIAATPRRHRDVASLRRSFFDQLAVADAHHLIDSVGQLVAAVLDMDARFTMVDVATVDIGITRHDALSSSDRRLGPAALQRTAVQAERLQLAVQGRALHADEGCRP